jgi:very-short-patch-repair endonuclease
MRDKVINDLATRQYGVVARPQLLAEGLDRGQVARAVAAGRLHRVHAGVYAVGHRALDNRGRWMAAVLACGAGAVLSHRSAGALYDLPVSDNGLTSVIARTAHTHRRVDAHRAQLHARDRATWRRIPVTSIARTLVDLAHVLDDESLHRVVKEAQFRELFDEAKVRDALTRRPSSRLAPYLGDPTVTQSKLEDRFLRLCRRHGIPTPTTQYGRKPRVDFIWHDARLIVEVDGWEGHRTRVAFQDDRTNTNALQLAGYVVLRFTYEDVKHRSHLVADQVRQALYTGNRSSTHSGPSGVRR